MFVIREIDDERALIESVPEDSPGRYAFSWPVRFLVPADAEDDA